MTSINPMTGQKVIKGAGLVADFFAVGRLWYVPDVGGVATGKKQFGDGSGDVRYLRVTVNAGDDVIASQRLLAGFPDTFQLNCDDALQIASAAAITRVDIVAVGDATSGSPAAGTLIDEADAIGDVQSAMVTYTFDADDDVRGVFVKSSAPYSATAAPATSANYSMVQVGGVGDA